MRVAAPTHRDAGFNVEVRTELPRTDYAILHALAEAKRTTIGRLVAECVRRQLHQKQQQAKYVKRRLMTDDDLVAVRELNSRGYNDSRIGRELGFAPSTIHGARIRLGLAKNTATGRKPSTPEGSQ